MKGMGIMSCNYKTSDIINKMKSMGANTSLENDEISELKDFLFEHKSELNKALAENFDGEWSEEKAQMILNLMKLNTEVAYYCASNWLYKNPNKPSAKKIREVRDTVIKTSQEKYRDIKFVGDYKRLKKEFGFKFQRLFADNYISYHNDRTIYVWRKGADVTVGNRKGVASKLLSYLIDNDWKLPLDGLLYDERENCLIENTAERQQSVFRMTLPERMKHLDRYSEYSIPDSDIDVLKKLYEQKMITI